MNFLLTLIVLAPSLLGFSLTKRYFWLIKAIYLVCIICSFALIYYCLSFEQPYTLTLFQQGFFKIGIHLDTLAAALVACVLTIGFWCLSFSKVYLQDENQQQACLLYMGFLLSAVVVMLLSADFTLLIIAGLAIRYNLNRLLRYYPQRPLARLGAKQFTRVSRLGDVCLVGAALLAMVYLGSSDFAVLRQQQVLAMMPVSAQIILTLLILSAACARSACWPLHFWLPNTMDTPLPVSALMHAGVINAGGYLLIRCSPLLIQHAHLLTAFALLAAFSTCLASLIMRTQTDIKNQLAYSTMAQMSFMLLQCGLGVFALAALHIISHGFYKAYAFLSSPTSVEYSKYKQIDTRALPSHLSYVALSLLIAVAVVALAFRYYPKNELLLIVIFFLAITQVLHLTESLANKLLMLLPLVLIYIGLTKLAMFLFAQAMPMTVLSYSKLDYVLLGGIIVLFGFNHLMLSNAGKLLGNHFAKKLYVSLYNGLYQGRYC